MEHTGPAALSSFFGIRLTSTLLATLVVDIFIVLLIVLVRRRLSLQPGKLQAVIESIVEYLRNITEQVAGGRTSLIFPWVAIFFIYITLSNIIGLLPGFGSIGFYQEAGFWGFLHVKLPEVPLLYVSTADLNVTLALAIVSVLATNVVAVRTVGLKTYLGRFFALNPLLLFVGLLELLQELTKFVTFSFRLYGNISAGEAVLGTMSALLAFVVPIPFLGFELLVAVIQGLVFALLTMAFMTMLTEPHHTEEKGT